MPTRLTDRQLNGLACYWCGREGTAMVPLGWGPRGQLFGCDPPCDPQVALGRTGAEVIPAVWLLTAEEVARLLGIDVKTIHAYHAQNLMPPASRHKGRTPLWDGEAISGWIWPKPSAKPQFWRKRPR